MGSVRLGDIYNCATVYGMDVEMIYPNLWTRGNVSIFSMNFVCFYFLWATFRVHVLTALKYPKLVRCLQLLMRQSGTVVISKELFMKSAVRKMSSQFNIEIIMEYVGEHDDSTGLEHDETFLILHERQTREPTPYWDFEFVFHNSVPIRSRKDINRAKLCAKHYRCATFRAGYPPLQIIKNLFDLDTSFADIELGH